MCLCVWGFAVPSLQEDFLRQKIKVDNKTGNLGERVKVSAEGAKINVVAEVRKGFFDHLIKYKELEVDIVLYLYFVIHASISISIHYLFL